MKSNYDFQVMYLHSLHEFLDKSVLFRKKFQQCPQISVKRFSQFKAKLHLNPV